MLAVNAEETIEKSDEQTATHAPVAALAVGGSDAGKLDKMSVADVDVKGKRLVVSFC